MKATHSLLLSAFVALPTLATLPAQIPESAPHALVLSGAFEGTHDPSIMKEGNEYYVFATGAAVFPLASPSRPSAPTGAASSADLPQLPIRCSSDLHFWRHCGAVFPQGILEWIRRTSPETRELWAPDISFYGGLYHLYYAYSVFGKNTSGIALATTPTLDQKNAAYKWLDHGPILQSTTSDNYNAIDPNLVVDKQGQPWLAFGSFWGGIKLRKLDFKTGKLSKTDTHTYSLAARAKPDSAPPATANLPPNWEAIEAPFILRHDRFYYLFVSWDLCCRGTRSTYRTMVGRSTSVQGPYIDRDGKPMMLGGGTPLLIGNSRWVGPGGESLLSLPSGDVIVFHAYDAETGHPALQISTISWANGWPSAALELRQL